MFSSWALVAIVAIIAGTVSSYLQNKNKKADRHRDEELLNNMEKKVERLTKRVQNLEAIAANDPDGFEEKNSTDYSEINLDDLEPEEQSKERVSRLANQLKNRQA